MDATELNYDADGLTTGAIYQFRIVAVNAVGNGPESSHVEVIAATVPATPAQISVKSASARHIAIDWIAPYNGGSDIRGYQVFLDGVFIDEGTGYTADFDEFKLNIIENIVPGKLTSIEILAINDVGASAKSPVMEIIAAEAPLKPVDMKLSSLRPNELTVVWDHPYDGGSELLTYTIWWKLHTAIAYGDSFVTDDAE